MNASDQPQNTNEAKNVFENLSVPLTGVVHDSFKVDLDQDDDTSDVMGLMPHVDAMAMAAESSPAATASNQSGSLCIQPTSTCENDTFKNTNPVPITSTTGNLFQNVITYVAIPANFTPIAVGNIPQINVENVPIIENVAALPITATPSQDVSGQAWLEAEMPQSSMTYSVNEFLKVQRKKGAVEVKEEEAAEVKEDTEVAGKMKKLEVRTLYVDYEKRKLDLADLRDKFPSMSFRQLDSLYMKMGCDLDRTIDSLTQKMEEEQAKRQKALEEWRKNYDKNKVVKRVSSNKTTTPLTKKQKLDDSGNDAALGSISCESNPVNQSITFPNKTIPSDVRAYKQFFRRVEGTDAGSQINAFMERNVVEYPASESEEKAKPVKMRTHTRYDYGSCCVPRSTNATIPCSGGTPSTNSHTISATESNQNLAVHQELTISEAVEVKKESQLEEQESTKIIAKQEKDEEQVLSEHKSDDILASTKEECDDKSVNIMGLDYDNYDHMDDDVEDDRLSNTSSNTRASNSSGGGTPWSNKFFRNKISTAAAIHKRAYVSRELNQAWTIGNKRPAPHSNPILEMTSNSAAIMNTTPMAKGRQRPKVWTASSDAVPVTPGKFRVNYGTPYTPHLKIPTDSVESSPTPENFSASPEKTSPAGDQFGDQRLSVLDFFNNGEIEDIATISNCSRKKANVIVNMRPFLSMKDLSSRLDKERSLSSTLISGCKELLQMRASVNRLLTKCQKISNTVTPRISSLIDSVKAEDDSSDVSTTWDVPACLNKEMTLKPYQIIGVKWLRLLHSLNLNGILADEMGLGKTVQTIAFLASLMENGDKGPHLVIVPSTTLENWCREFDIWCPNLRVLLYYGSFEERKAMRKEVYESGKTDFNVILTTYSVATNSIEDRTMMKRLDIHYGVFDEAHMLKNMTSQRYRYLMTFKIQRRLLLTGTPLQNNLLELMSLLSFVMPSLFAMRETTEILKRFFQTCSRFRDDRKESNGTNVLVHSYEKQRVQQAKSLLRPFILRRMKSHVLSQLPPKIDVVERVALPPVQMLRYVDLVTEMREQLRRTTNDQDAAPMSMLMQLRKAANHTLLHRRVFTNEMLREMARALKKKEPSHKKAKEQLIYEDLCVLNDFEIHKICELYKDYIGSFALSKETIVSSSGKLMYLDASLPSMLTAGNKILLFSQFVIVLDVIEEFLRLRGYRFVRLDGTTRVTERQDLIDKFQTDPDVLIFLMSTRCGGLGINLTAANVVILHDIDYNPYNDRQAEDRCHRVGQSRDVKVIRLLAANTLEEGMYRMANAKLRLEEDITGDFNVSYCNIKHEPEDEEEENEAQLGSKRNTSKEAEQAENTELSSSELKEVKELLREALYPKKEEDKLSTVPTDGTGNETEPIISGSKILDTEVSTEVKHSTLRQEVSETKVPPDVGRSDDINPSSPEIKHNPESQNQSSLTQRLCNTSVEPSSGETAINVDNNTRKVDQVNDEPVAFDKRGLHQSESNCHSADSNSHSQDVTSTPKSDETLKTLDVSGSTHEPDLPETTMKVSDIKVVTNDDNSAFDTLADSSEVEKKFPGNLEAVDEENSVQSNNEKGSNPSEMSEDSRPLVISELRGSTDSEEIDVVGENT